MLFSAVGQGLLVGDAGMALGFLRIFPGLLCYLLASVAGSETAHATSRGILDQYHRRGVLCRSGSTCAGSTIRFQKHPFRFVLTAVPFLEPKPDVPPLACTPGTTLSEISTGSVSPALSVSKGDVAR